MLFILLFSQDNKEVELTTRHNNSITEPQQFKKTLTHKVQSKHV